MLPSLPQIPAPQKRKKSIKQLPPPLFETNVQSLARNFLQEFALFCNNFAGNFARRCTILQNKLQETWQEFAMFCQQILQKIFCNDFASDDT